MQEDHPTVDVTTPWDPSRGVPDPPSAYGGSNEWEYVDPTSYSNPATETPVYTSGLQQAPQVPDAGHSPFGPPPSGPPQGMPPPMAPPLAAPPPAAPAPAGPAAPAGPLDPTASADYHPGAGDLKIKERRAWHTWQLVLVACIAAVLGMWLYAVAGPNTSTVASHGGSASGAYKLPPAAGSGAATTVPSGSSSGGAAGASTTTTTGAAGATTTTTGAAGGTSPTTAPVTVGPATVLVPQTQLTGNWTSPAFTIAGGTWNIGWAFQCVPAPTATPSFQIFVVNNGGAPSGSPAVTSTAASGNSVTPLTSTGSQQIIVQTSPTCRWITKVTGSSS